jgi:hypothetical protein
MDEGLGFALVPIFVIVLSIVISSFILYFILRNKKMSIIGSIIGFIGTIIVGYIFGLIWYIAQIVGGSQLAPFLILIVSSMLTAFMGLIVIKIFGRLKTVVNAKFNKRGKNMTRKKMIIGIIVLIAALLIIKEIVAYYPYFMVGAPLGVFGISNRDSTNHSVNIQVFDSNNRILLNKTYELGHSQPGQWVPEQFIQYPENGWKSVYDKDKLFPKGNYTFIITLDNNVAQTFQEKLDTWRVANVVIDNNGNLSVGAVVS